MDLLQSQALAAQRALPADADNQARAGDRFELPFTADLLGEPVSHCDGNALEHTVIRAALACSASYALSAFSSRHRHH